MNTEYLLVELAPEGPREDREGLAAELRDHLDDQDVLSDFATAPGTPGTKSGEIVDLAVLALPLLQDPALLKRALECLLSFRPGRRSCSVRVRRDGAEVIVTDLSARDARRLLAPLFDSARPL